MSMWETLHSRAQTAKMLAGATENPEELRALARIFSNRAAVIESATRPPNKDDFVAAITRVKGNTREDK